MLRRSKVEEELRHLFEKEKFGAIAYSALAYGLLSGKYNIGTKSEGGRLRMDSAYLKQWARIRGFPSFSGTDPDV